jgi:uncharacterized protein with LGFP repeats
VYIANKATAALYYYTPYQPTQTALDAGYGSSPDHCASYGNRNFFLYFTDWFGSTGSLGPAMIDAAYAAHGGAAGPLGAPASDYNSIRSNGGGIVRGYTNGAIAWSKSAGAFVISGSIRDYFNSLGGIAGSFGWPHTDANDFDANGGGSVQGFQNGAITQSTVVGIFTLSGRMREAYNQFGSISGPLGWPAANQECSASGCSQAFQYASIDLPSSGVATIRVPAVDAAYEAAGGENGPLGKALTGVLVNASNGGGFVRAFTGGAIASSAGNGAHVISGAVREYYNSQGGLASYLGWPTGDVSCDASNACVQSFVGGSVFVDGKDGQPTSMNSAIRDLYLSLGGSAGVLGAPSGSTSTLSANGGGLVQGFASGAITYTAAAGAVALTGDIRTAFGSVGGLTGAFGWPTGPTSKLSANGGGLVQGFQNGAIAQSTAGTFPLSGDIRAVYGSVAGTAGQFGWPTTGPIATNGGIVQAFQGGAIAQGPWTGAHALTGTFRQAYATVGGIGGKLGWPTGDVVTVATQGGGTLQRFEHGVVTQRSGLASAAIITDGPIRDYFNSLGGLSGVLGWPTQSQVCTSTANCTQTFEGGILSWSASTGIALRS